MKTYFLFVFLLYISVTAGAESDNRSHSDCLWRLQSYDLAPVLKRIPVENPRSKDSKEKVLSPDDIRIALQVLEKSGLEISTKLFKKTDATLDGLISGALKKKVTMDVLYDSLVRRYKSPTAARRLLLDDDSEDLASGSPGLQRNKVIDWINKTAGHLLDSGLKLNWLALIKNKDNPKVKKLLDIINNTFNGNLFEAFFESGLDTHEIFQRDRDEKKHAYSVSSLVKVIKSHPIATQEESKTKNIEKAIASEFPPESASLVQVLLHALFHSTENTAQELAAKCSEMLNRPVDGIKVMAQLRILAANRTLLDYLQI